MEAYFNLCIVMPNIYNEESYILLYCLYFVLTGLLTS